VNEEPEEIRQSRQIKETLSSAVLTQSRMSRKAAVPSFSPTKKAKVVA
jgi:hypothetical protein